MTLTSAAAAFTERDRGGTVALGPRRYVHPWWAMFAHWEQDEATVVDVRSPTVVALGRVRRRKYKLEWLAAEPGRAAARRVRRAR